MKKDKFKKMRLQVETLEPIEKPDDCVLLLSGLQMEMPEAVHLSVAGTDSRKMMAEDGTLYIGLEARGIQSDQDGIRQLRLGKQAEIMDYHFFKSRLSTTVITDVQAELFDFRQKKIIPFAVKKLEFTFNNGKRIDFTNHLSIFFLNKMAS